MVHPRVPLPPVPEPTRAAPTSQTGRLARVPIKPDAAFHALGHRPEEFGEVCLEAALGSGSASLREARAGGAETLRARHREEREAQHAALSPLQQAVLARLQ